MRRRGWHREPARHSLAARGVKTRRSPSKARCIPHKSVSSDWKPSEKEVIKKLESDGLPVDKLPKNPAKYYREKYPNAWWPENVDWKQIEYELEAAEVSKGYDWGARPCKEISFGSIFSVTPSGKYYTSWARSNVTDKEALADAWVMAELDLAAWKRGMYITSMEGDPTELVIGMTVDE